jgi:RAT1-interacting protein
MDNFHRKLMKYWIQSFLLGVPKIIVGFRTREGILVDVSEVDTQGIPQTVNSRPNPAWNADMCVNFAGEFLECTPAMISFVFSCRFADSCVLSAWLTRERAHDDDQR